MHSVSRGDSLVNFFYQSVSHRPLHCVNNNCLRNNRREQNLNLFSLALSASLRAGLRRKEGFVLGFVPALIPHPGEPGLGNVPGYYQTSREARD
jgi:hypothetical protein